MIKIVVAGSRDFARYDILKSSLDQLLLNEKDVTIISGTARGADQLGERYAKEKGYGLLRFPANWDKFGKSAGYIRNEEMAENTDAVVVFWNGSRGTKHMIDIAKRKNLLCVVLDFDGNETNRYVP